MLTKDDMNLPQWVRDNIMMTCPHCGSPIDSNHETGVLTERWCSNPKCPGHMAYRMDYIGKYFGIKGFGPKTALDYIKSANVQSHLDVIKIWFPDKKPCESLSRIADLACIKEFGLTQAQAILDKYSSFDDFLMSPDGLEYGYLFNHLETLHKAQEVFDVKKPMLGKTLYIMITGSIHGFISRDAWVDALNAKVGHLIHIVQVGARKSNVSVLVKEPDAVDHRKSRLAKEAGIPILSSDEFYDLVLNLYQEYGGNLDDFNTSIED